jgi:hypothetical protein
MKLKIFASLSESIMSNDQELRWERSEYGQVPSDAIAGGVDLDGSTLFIGRAEHEGGSHTGKVSTTNKALYIGYGGEEIALNHYEVLCGNPNLIKWVECQGPVKADNNNLFLAGHDTDGTSLYIAKFSYGPSILIGKANPNFEWGAAFSYESKEINTQPTDTYYVLATA